MLTGNKPVPACTKGSSCLLKGFSRAGSMSARPSALPRPLRKDIIIIIICHSVQTMLS